jgi:signal peptidase II
MKKYIYIIIGLVLLLDQITKLLVTSFITLGDNINIISNVLYLTYVKNTGAAWSILQGKQILLIILAIMVLIFLIKLIYNSNLSKYEFMGYLLIISGVLGNLIDRIVHGYVIDFIGIYIFNYVFPIFNISDMAIVIGVSIFIIDIIRGNVK